MAMVARIWLTVEAVGSYRHHLTSIYRKNALLLYGYWRKGLDTWTMTVIARVSLIAEASGKYCNNLVTNYRRSSLVLYSYLARLQTWIMAVVVSVNMFTSSLVDQTGSDDKVEFQILETNRVQSQRR